MGLAESSSPSASESTRGDSLPVLLDGARTHNSAHDGSDFPHDGWSRCLNHQTRRAMYQLRVAHPVIVSPMFHGTQCFRPGIPCILWHTLYRHKPRMPLPEITTASAEETRRRTMQS